MKAVINLSAKSPVLPQFPFYGICMLESRHAMGFTMAPSAYEFFEVMLILEGSGWVIHRKVRHPVCKGNLVVVPAEEAYFYEDSADSPLAMFSLCILPPKEGVAHFFEGVLPAAFAVVRSFSLSREIAGHMRAIFFEQSRVRGGSAAVALAQTLLILSNLARRQESMAAVETIKGSPSDVHLLVRVRDYIAKLETTFHTAETIHSVAERLGMSPRSFTHHFRAVTGVSRHRYIQTLRLQHACHLLAQTDESVTSIAFTCGFEDLSNFFRAFRAKEKMSPNQWRERHGKEDGNRPGAEPKA